MTETIVMNHVIELNTGNFEAEVLGSQEPVLVHFWADWSEPSQAMNPVVESVAQDEATPVKVGRVNVERQGGLAAQYGVQALPTLLIFSKGGLHDQIVGRATEQEVRERLGCLR